MDDPHLFSGRRDQTRQLAMALHDPGSCPIIFGDRGLGKTSLALQIQLTALGDRTLLDQHSLARWAIAPESSYISFYTACTRATRTKDDILRRLLASVGSLTAEGANEVDQLVDRTTRRRVSLKLFELETIRRFETAKVVRSHVPSTVEDEFLESTASLTEVTGHRVLVVVDELELAGSTEGLAAFIKMASSDRLKFILVGIAHNISELIHDHRSLARVIVPTELGPMEFEELVQIGERAAALLAGSGLSLTIGPEARVELAHLSGGYPWFVHLLGQAALVDAYENQQPQVVVDDIHLAAARLAENRFAQQFADTYHSAIGRSRERAAVLHAFAAWPEKDIPLSEIYRQLTEASGIKRPGRHKSALTLAGPYGPVLVPSPGVARGRVRFADEVFRVYVRLYSRFSRVLMTQDPHS